MEVFGEVPLARFGHTVTQVSKSKVVIFGGATGDTGKYIITGDTYVLDLIGSKWSKLEGKQATSLNEINIQLKFKPYSTVNLIWRLIYFLIGQGISPSPRAAAGSCQVDQL